MIPAMSSPRSTPPLQRNRGVRWIRTQPFQSLTRVRRGRGLPGRAARLGGRHPEHLVDEAKPPAAVPCSSAARRRCARPVRHSGPRLRICSQRPQQQLDDLILARQRQRLALRPQREVRARADDIDAEVDIRIGGDLAPLDRPPIDQAELGISPRQYACFWASGRLSSTESIPRPSALLK